MLRIPSGTFWMNRVLRQPPGRRPRTRIGRRPGILRNVRLMSSPVAGRPTSAVGVKSHVHANNVLQPLQVRGPAGLCFDALYFLDLFNGNPHRLGQFLSGGCSPLLAEKPPEVS